MYVLYFKNLLDVIVILICPFIEYTYKSWHFSNAIIFLNSFIIFTAKGTIYLLELLVFSALLNMSLILNLYRKIIISSFKIYSDFYRGKMKKKDILGFW